MSSTKEKQEELEDNINKVLKIVSEEECVPGAGTAELILSKQMKKKLLGKEQLSYEAYAQALKEITKKLIKNSGQDITRELTKLKNGQGVGVKDPVKEGIIEPLKLKKQLINTATETAIMILRIDSIIKGK